MSMSVCVFECEQTAAHITQYLRDQTSTNFLCMLPVAVPRSSSDGISIRYVLQVLWMTSYFHTMGSTGRIMEDMFRRSLLGGTTIPFGCHTTTVFSLVCQNAALGPGDVCCLQLPCC